MERTVKTRCSICTKTDECRHFEIYVFGSEGVWLCHRGELTVCQFIRDCSTIAERVKMECHIKQKQVS